MAASPSWAATPKVSYASISTANTLRDGTGTLGTVFSAGASGSRIDLITVQATATTTQGTVRLFLHDGAVAKLFREVQVSPVVPSSTQPAFNVSITLDGGMSIPAGYSLRASTNNAEAFNVFGFGGDY